MSLALALLLSLLGMGASLPNHHRIPEAVTVGWHDDFRNPERWTPIEMENKPIITADSPGSLTMTLAAVPTGWPYAYQWSGVTREIAANIGRYPVLVAYISNATPGSYAHLEVEDRSASTPLMRQDSSSSRMPGMGIRPSAPPLKRVERGSTVTAPGLSFVDLGAQWGASSRHMQIRLIVGGKNEGAACTYSWVRFIRREDLPRLQSNPQASVVSHIVEPVQPAPSPTAITPRRVTLAFSRGFGWSGAPVQRLRAFIPTGSDTPPMVCLADNTGFPEVQAVYAHPGRMQRQEGVYVDVVFAQPWSGNPNAALAFNLWQPGMKGSLTPLTLPQASTVNHAIGPGSLDLAP